MMAATRRSWSARKASPKSRKRSRKSHHDYHDPDRRPDLTFPEQSQGKDDGRRYRPSSSHFSGSGSKHGDIADSGIDSGNGHADPDSPLARLGKDSSEHVSAGHVPEQKHSSSPERQTHALSESGDMLNDNLPLREIPDKMSPSTHHSDENRVSRSQRRSRSKHRKRTPSGSEDQQQKKSATEEKTPHRDFPSGGSIPVPENDPRTYTSPSSHIPNNSETSSLSSVQTERPVKSDAKDRSVSVRDSKENEDDDDNERKESSDSEQDTSETVKDDDRKSSDTVSVTSDKSDRKRKLKGRLEQAKHSLASPHIIAVVESYESSENTHAGPQDMCLLQEFRRLFHQELIRLRLELDSFRHFCSKQMEQEAEAVFCRHTYPQGEEETATEETANQRNNREESSTQSKVSEGEKAKDEGSEETKEKKTEELDKWEETLSARQKDLVEYEKEILEVETMLNQRQAICERRQSALLALDEELQGLREDIFNKKETINKDTDTSEERARKNWDLIRRHLTDKQAMLEAAVQRYKTQIASCNAALAAKDTLIAHLQKQLKETQDTVKARDKKINQLESKLVLASEEMHVLTKHDSYPLPSDSDPLSHSQNRRASLRPGSGLLQRQKSETSDRSGRGSMRSSSASDTHQTINGSERNSGHRATSSMDRRASSANAPELNRRKSRAALSRNLSARERRLQQRRASSDVGDNGDEEAANSTACTIL